MRQDFPEIVDFGSALRFALYAERAGADFAAEAGVVAPDQDWRDRLEVLLCTHDDRVQKLMAVRRQADEASSDPLHGLDATPYLAVLTVEPAATWPDAAEQLARVEEAIAGYHDAFASHAGDVLGTQAHLFTKAARQEREAAEELRRLLD